MEEFSENSLIDQSVITNPVPDNTNWNNPFSNEQLFPNCWTFNNPIEQTQQNLDSILLPVPSLFHLITPELSSMYDPNCLYGLTSPDLGSICEPAQEDYCYGLMNAEGTSRYVAKVENMEENDGVNVEKNGEIRHCSKNLMAERRRRKRLNDRLSMLRSIVPKFSKMDRTSIVGDTIDYLRELLYKINELRLEGIDENASKISLIGPHTTELKPNEVVRKNTAKVNVERRDQETRIEVSCPTKPGLMLSTLGTLDMLGLEVDQCVISCFNGFSVKASCCEVAENQYIPEPEDVKQALFINAGYDGRCPWNLKSLVSQLITEFLCSQ